MSEAAFIEYALSPGLSPDERHTLDLLIDRAFQTLGWDAYKGRREARQKPGYTPVFPKELIKKVARELMNLTWLNLQGSVIKNIAVLRFFGQLEGLALGQNQISDLGALGCMSQTQAHQRTRQRAS